ncbi:hypothetical protein CRUP_032277 [Coryphaenoides rupestris]|nr:hypothetical protein CRUP_032277 [Coryphaenoides rupestris]
MTDHQDRERIPPDQAAGSKPGGNVSHLTRLRVLNLAGNEITRVDNLRGLDALTELNLQRNCISSVVSGPFLIV